MLIDRREIAVDKLFKHFADIDSERAEERRKTILNDCRARDSKISTKLWHCVREGSIFKKCFGGRWEMYEDPDCGNYFYTKLPVNRLMGDDYTDYSWTEPTPAKALIDRTNGMNYLMKIRSTLLRQCEEWFVYRCNKTKIEFFYNAKTEQLTFSTPKHLKWRSIMREAVKTGERLGYGNEWEVMKDKYGNTFYRNALSRVSDYDQPLDAIEVKPAEMLCTSYQVSLEGFLKMYFICLSIKFFSGLFLNCTIADSFFLSVNLPFAFAIYCLLLIKSLGFTHSYIHTYTHTQLSYEPNSTRAGRLNNAGSLANNATVPGRLVRRAQHAPSSCASPA